MPQFRLDRYLSEMGIAGRKELKQIIRSGRVTVNDVIQTSPEYKINTDRDVIVCDGTRVSYVQFRYFMLDKPAGYLSATEDGKQQTVLELFPEEIRRLDIFPVGRLDKDTSGLLLLTNDGEFAHKVISPKSEIKKRYYAVTEGIPDEEDVKAFRDGILLKDGLECLPAELEITGRNECFVTVMEGKYHQVKRMLAARGKPVLQLRRLSVGKLTLREGQASGEYVELDEQDLKAVLWSER